MAPEATWTGGGRLQVHAEVLGGLLSSPSLNPFMTETCALPELAPPRKSNVSTACLVGSWDTSWQYDLGGKKGSLLINQRVIFRLWSSS